MGLPTESYSGSHWLISVVKGSDAFMEHRALSLAKCPLPSFRCPGQAAKNDQCLAHFVSFIGINHHFWSQAYWDRKTPDLIQQVSCYVLTKGRSLNSHYSLQPSGQLQHIEHHVPSTQRCSTELLRDALAGPRVAACPCITILA